MPGTGSRPLRADARRNRERLLAAAVSALADGGGEATLEAIAKDAGVGIGTLYRHFPTREALVEAAYRNELTRLCEAAPQLLDAGPADRATRVWMDRFVDYMIAKRGMADALRAVVASGGNPFAHSRDLLVGTLSTLLEAGAREGALRTDTDPADVLTALSGVSLAAGRPDNREQAGRLLDLLMDGLRHGAGGGRGRAREDRAGLPGTGAEAGNGGGPGRGRVPDESPAEEVG